MKYLEADAGFKFWSLTIPGNSKKKLNMEIKNSVYHISNATFGDEVTKGRSTIHFKANGNEAPICSLISNCIENANLDFIISRCMNPSFIVKGCNEVTVSGYVQLLPEKIEEDIPKKNFSEGNVGPSSCEKVAQTFGNRPPGTPVDSMPVTSGGKTNPKKRKVDEVNAVEKSQTRKKFRTKKESEKDREEAATEIDGTKKVMEQLKPTEVKKSNVDEPGLLQKSNSGKAQDNIGTWKAAEIENSSTDNNKKVSSEDTMVKEEKKNKILQKDKLNSSKKVDFKPKNTVENLKTQKNRKKRSKKMIDAGRGVKYRVKTRGQTGINPAKNGDSITVRYVGLFKDGTIFDKNLKDGFTFTIGRGDVIRGIEIGVLGICKGEKRLIVIPAEHGYGVEGTPDGSIPPNAVLHFTVQRLK